MNNISQRYHAKSHSAGPENTATMLAWQNARDTYRKSLPDKSFKRILVPAGPEDVLEDVGKMPKKAGKEQVLLQGC